MPFAPSSFLFLVVRPGAPFVASLLLVAMLLVLVASLLYLRMQNRMPKFRMPSGCPGLSHVINVSTVSTVVKPHNPPNMDYTNA